MSNDPKHTLNLWAATTRAEERVHNAFSWLHWCFDQMEPGVAARATKALLDGKTPAEFMEAEEKRKAKK